MKKIGLIVGLLCMFECPCFSDQSESYRTGFVHAQGHQQKSIDLLKQIDPSRVPGFQGDASYNVSLDPGSLTEKALQTSFHHPASTYMRHHARDKKKITVHEGEDIFVNADRAVTNPEKTLHNITVIKQGSEGDSHDDIVTCEESGDAYTQSCSRFRHVTLRVTPEKGHHTPKSCIGHWKSKVKGTKWYCAGCRGGDYVVDEPKKVEVISESWSEGCDVLEHYADEGLCRYVALSQGPPETRTIQGEPVHRDHWEEHATYTCQQKIQNTCTGLRARGCHQIASTCLMRKGSVCTRWRQTYSCQRKTHHTLSYKAQGQNVPFCLMGDCVDTRYEENAEMLEALSHLAILGEAQKDMRSHIGVFKGQPRGCRKNCTNFRDCCTTGHGWGMSLNLAECRGEEKELADWRHKKRCILVGTYCAEKVLGTCIRKITTFCCFGTKLSCLIQEQGRRQLGLRFGTPECPDCRGFTPEELSRLDFSKMDLSPLFEDISENFKTPDTKEMNQKIQERIHDNMNTLTQGLKSRNGTL